MRKILITGCAGFIGSQLAQFYLDQNCTVFGIDNFCTGSKSNIKELENYKSFYFFEHDVSEPWTALRLLKVDDNFDFVFHLASPAAVNQYQNLSLETMRANSVGLQNALTFATSKAAKLIFSSTSEIYGSPKLECQNESYWGHVNSFGERSCYDESKRFGEALIFSWNKRYATKHGLVRIFNTYGPRMNPEDGRAINRFVRQALKNEDLTVYGTGNQTRSFCYITDLIKGLDLYCQSPFSRPVNLGNDEEITIYKLANLVIQITDSSSKIIHQPLPQDDPPQRRPNLTYARENLKFDPRINLKQGLLKMIESKNL